MTSSSYCIKQICFVFLNPKERYWLLIHPVITSDLLQPSITKKYNYLWIKIHINPQMKISKILIQPSTYKILIYSAHYLVNLFIDRLYSHDSNKNGKTNNNSKVDWLILNWPLQLFLLTSFSEESGKKFFVCDSHFIQPWMVPIIFICYVSACLKFSAEGIHQYITVRSTKIFLGLRVWFYIDKLFEVILRGFIITGSNK